MSEVWQKKVLLANNIGLLHTAIIGMEFSEISVLTAWLGGAAYTLQIYFDFGGYSDMAIGLGRMFGFHFMKNFDYPYISKSITEFWHRWHISLSTWFKEYVYIPLGGNKGISAKTCHQYYDCMVPYRIVAWCKLELCCVGTLLWRVAID